MTIENPGLTGRVKKLGNGRTPAASRTQARAAILYRPALAYLAGDSPEREKFPKTGNMHYVV